MTAEEYYKYTTQQQITGELKGVIMYNWYSLIHFAEAYHANETKHPKTAAMSCTKDESAPPTAPPATTKCTT